MKTRTRPPGVRAERREPAAHGTALRHARLISSPVADRFSLTIRLDLSSRIFEIAFESPAIAAPC